MVKDYVEYTRGITLRDLVLETGSRLSAIAEFNNMQWWLSRDCEVYTNNVYSRIISPIIFPIEGSKDEQRVKSYYNAIKALLNQSAVRSVNVRESSERRMVKGSKKWINIYRGGATSKTIEFFAEIASKEPLKINYFEVVFREEKKSWIGKKVEEARIEFCEYKQEIIGYQILVPPKYRNLFNIETERNEYEWNIALWVPENYLDLPRPFAKDKDKS